MYQSDEWQDYELLDCGGGEKLERWGDVTLLRPDPQAIWPMDQNRMRPDAHYLRSNSGGGAWEYARTLPQSWQISLGELRFVVRPTGFKHTGLFPEQAVNWRWMQERIRAAKRPVRVLNLFAYTGGATVACLAAGAEVVHVDAAKGMVAWAKDNAAATGVADGPVRWIVDDVLKFVQREERRGRKYQGILMDPPSYGRGPGGEVWKIEDNLFPLVDACMKIVADDPVFFLINSYTTGLAPTVLQNVLRLTMCARFGGHVEADEVGLPVTRRELVLPCGASGRWWA